MSAATVSRWETEAGNPPGYEYLEALSGLLGISKDQLVDAIGVRLNPAPEAELYSPLVEMLHEMTRRQQEALHKFLLETSTGSVGQ